MFSLFSPLDPPTRMNWHSFYKYLHKTSLLTDNVNSTNDIGNNVNFVISKIRKAIDVSSYSVPHRFTLASDIRNLIYSRTQLHKMFINTRDSAIEQTTSAIG